MSEPTLTQKPPSSRNNLLLALALFILAILPFAPAFNGEFLWDDNLWLTEAKPVLDAQQGLSLIWSDVFKKPESKTLLHYYPLVYTTFWFEYRVFGPNPLGYHLVNTLLHAASTLLLWQLLRRLGLKAAWLAALLWAVHPIQVETVAWIAERKNTLSALFAFASLLMYLRFERMRDGTPDDSHPPHWPSYILSFLFFTLALLSKTVVCTLPAVLFVLLWWRRKKLAPRTLLALAPMLIYGLAFALITSVQETQFVVPPNVTDFQLSPADRIFLAGRNIVFYLSSQLFPYPLMPIQPQWKVSAANPSLLLSTLFVAALLPTLWLLRKKVTIGPFIALLLFCIAISPALGFINFYTMMYTYVTDHYQYHASAATLTLLAEALFALALFLAPSKDRLLRGLSTFSLADLKPLLAVTAPVVLIFISLSLFYSTLYQSPMKLWLWNVEKNDSAWMAHQNLAVEYMRSPSPQNKQLALAHALRSYELRPNDTRTALSVGRLLAAFGKPADAEKYVRLSLEMEPRYTLAWSVLGDIQLRLNQPAAARDSYLQAVTLDPDLLTARLGLAASLKATGDLPRALTEYETAVRTHPQNIPARYDLANLYLDLQRYNDAISHYQIILKSQPNNPNVWHNLAVAYYNAGDKPNALRARATAQQLEAQIKISQPPPNP